MQMSRAEKINKLETDRKKIMAETHTHSEWVKIMDMKLSKISAQLLMLKDGVRN